jgi:drug/metabolite transporter (DMT)-like permease
MPSFHLSARQIQLLLMMTVIWGINWTVMKYATNQMPPLSFRTISMFLALLTLWVMAASMQVSLKVPRQLLSRVMLLAIPNMIGWHILCILAVNELSAGRAAILGYTMPVWAVIAGLFFGQTMSRRSWAGLALAMVGVMLLLVNELQSMVGKPLGVLLMLGAAFSWGLGTILIRRYPTGLHALTFTHAMLYPTLASMVLATWVMEGSQFHFPSGFSQWWPVLYNSIGVIAFCQVGWFSLAASLPPIVSSLSIMIIPVVGVMSGVVFLGEQPRWTDLAALGSILAAMAVVLMPTKTANSS